MSESPNIFNEFKNLRIDDYNRKYSYPHCRRYQGVYSPEWFLGYDHPNVNRLNILRQRNSEMEEALPQFIDYPVNGKVYRSKAIKKIRQTKNQICISNPGKRRK